MNSLKNELEQFICLANDVVEMKLVKSEEDFFNDKAIFRPEFTHQLFGQTENIFGYKNLRIQLYYSAARLSIYLNHTFTEKIDPTKYDGVQADNVIKAIVDKLEVHPITSKDKFITELAKESSFRPSGTLLNSYSRTHEGSTSHFEIYKNDMSTPGFREYHERLQTFLWWFIDAASYIDPDDERWGYYTFFERQVEGSNTRYSSVGYITVYKYYAYPDKIRQRISQMLILPPYQRQGHGSEVLETVYRDFISDPIVFDITVEDPSDNFVRLRDYIDCKNCKQLPAFQADKLSQGFSHSMENEALDKFKIHKKQARRVYEILRLQATDMSNPKEVKAYRLEIKRRLNIPFQKQRNELEKLKKVLKPEELTAAMQGVDIQERYETLEKWYQEVIEEYRKVTARLSTI
ncbi:histone acetyltransferase type B catalytic subunit-like [Anneissia japonica]|uniref:histone acetyltransferase type B catalytic subunit-like n=1 Tax=Anneissia japonica TaxID=1529436 RepID=UPI00142566D3|nr:histone acetyltransferase type B catalytic subunit-like [Anneissia japonica]